MTNGLFVYALIMYIVGCIGFLFGKYFMTKVKEKKINENR